MTKMFFKNELRRKNTSDLKNIVKGLEVDRRDLYRELTEQGTSDTIRTYGFKGYEIDFQFAKSTNRAEFLRYRRYAILSLLRPLEDDIQLIKRVITKRREE